MKINKKITFITALTIIVGVFMYFSLLIGTLAHELVHSTHAKSVEAIIVEYDTSGEMRGSTFKHSHEWVYFNGWIVESCVFMILLASLIVIVKNGRYV